MFYKLKIKLMEKILKKRQSDNPFDYEKAESFKLKSDESPRVNNSYYFSAHDYENEISLFCRLGQRTSGNEVWFYYKDKERRLVLNTLIYKDNSPLKVEKVDGKWIVKFDGELEDSNKKLTNVSFVGQFTSNEEPIDFFSNMPRIRMAKAMSFEKRSKKFFEEVQANNQVHYEQFGRLEGKLKIEGSELLINLPCVRDHSFGARDWDYMNNHLWLMALNETKQLNFSMVSYPAMTLLEVGNFNTLNEKTKYVLEAAYDRGALIKGIAPETFEVKLHLENKEEMTVKAEIIDAVDYYFADGDYKFIEAIAEYDIEGEKFRGIFEVGFNKNEARFFNGKDVKSLKA